MHYLFYENFGKLEDNGFWNLAYQFSHIGLLAEVNKGDTLWRVFIKDDILYLAPGGVDQALTYKLRLGDYQEREQNELIDIFYPILV